jgi:hypothetical protein
LQQYWPALASSNNIDNHHLHSNNDDNHLQRHNRYNNLNLDNLLLGSSACINSVCRSNDDASGNKKNIMNKLRRRRRRRSEF